MWRCSSGSSYFLPPDAPSHPQSQLAAAAAAPLGFELGLLLYTAAGHHPPGFQPRLTGDPSP
jgi:hypothetical protein